VLATGTRWDTEQFYSASDIYLDSVPFSSITSLLEAAIRGIPVLGFLPGGHDSSLLGPGAPGLDGVMRLATTPDEYRSALRDLILHNEVRQKCAAPVQSLVSRLHTGDGWRDALENTYLKARSSHSRGCFARDHDVLTVSPLNSSLQSLYGQTRDRRFESRLLSRHLGPLNYISRVALSTTLVAQGFPLSLSNFLPRFLDPRMRATARAFKAVLIGASPAGRCYRTARRGTCVRSAKGARPLS
jgi:hypothetical protein